MISTHSRTGNNLWITGQIFKIIINYTCKLLLHILTQVIPICGQQDWYSKNNPFCLNFCSNDIFDLDDRQSLTCLSAVISSQIPLWLGSGSGSGHIWGCKTGSGRLWQIDTCLLASELTCSTARSASSERLWRFLSGLATFTSRINDGLASIGSDDNRLCSSSNSSTVWYGLQNAPT